MPMILIVNAQLVSLLARNAPAGPNAPPVYRAPSSIIINAQPPAHTATWGSTGSANDALLHAMIALFLLLSARHACPPTT